MQEKLRSIIEGKFIAVITGFKVNKIKKHYAVEIKIAVHTGTEIMSFSKLYSKIFTNGRARFQEICTDFELLPYDTNKEFDLSKILGVYCITEFKEDEGMISITPATPKEVIEYDPDSLFADVQIQEDTPELPELIKHYCFFPEIDTTNPRPTKLTGIITNINLMHDKNNRCEDTLCFDISVVDGGRCKKYQYYINRIDTDGKHDLTVLLDYFDIPYNYELSYLGDLIYQMCSVTLYEASSGRIYVSSVEPCIFNNKSKEKQYNIFLNSYINYLEKPDEIYDFTEL